MKPSKVCERCGGKIDMKTGKCTECGVHSMSKGFSPAQLEVMTRAGGAFKNRANAAKYGKANNTYLGARSDQARGRAQREWSTLVYRRAAPLKGTRGSKFDSVAPERRVFVNPNSDAAWKLNRAKASGATFGANNPANRVAKPKRSMASAKSRVRAKLGMKSY